MKKKITVLLTTILTVALSSPAFAASEEAYDDAIWETETYTEEYYTDSDEEEWIAAWKEQNPDLVTEILKDNPPLWQQWGYDSMEEFMLDYGFTTEEEYYDYVLYWYADDYYYDYIWQLEEAELIRGTRLSMGGTEEGLAVMYNGTYVAFPNTQPETVDGRAMVPVRDLMEGIGGEVEYFSDTGSVALYFHDVEITFAVGSGALEVTANGETIESTMDSASYCRDGVTYASVRAICEAAGYDVYWDDAYDTAVVLDQSAIISGIDETYSIVNKLFGIGETDPLKTYQTICSLVIDYTEFDTLDGDQTAEVTVNVETIQDGTGQETTVTMDTAGLLDFLKILNNGEELDEETQTALNDMAQMSVDVILNLDDERMYVKSNLFKVMDVGIDENVWFMLDSSDIPFGFGWQGLLSDSAEETQETTFGSLIYQTTAGSGYDSVFYYNNMMETADALSILSDKMFVKDGESEVLSVSLEDYDTFLTALLGSDYDESDAQDFLDTFEECAIMLSITDHNGTVSATGSFNVRENPDYTWSDVRYSGAFSLSGEKLSLSLTFHEKNVSKLLLNVELTMAETDETVPTAPPSESTVINIADYHS